MATTKVSALAALTNTDGNEELLINDGGTSKKVIITNVLPDDSVLTKHIAAGNIGTTEITDDAVTAAKLANSINAEITANTAKTSNATHSGDVTGATALTIAADAVTYAKMQNVSATDRILGRDSASAGIIEEITPANLRTMINVEDGATADQSNAEIVAAVEAGSDSNTFTDADHTKLNGITASANAYVHPNHSGEVTSTADGATVIVDNIVDEANLKVSNSATNGHFLSAQSGNAGGLTWAEAAGGVGGATGLDFNDSVKARFGTGNDLEIYHDGSDSIIRDAGTGSLEIRSNEIKIKNAAGDENAVYFAEDGAVNLYHNNAAKLATTATGITVTGAIGGATNLGKITKVTMAYNSSTRSAFGYSRDLFARNNEMVGHKVGFAFVKDSATTDIMVVFSMQVAALRDCYQCATYSGTNYSSTFFKRFAFAGSTSIGDNDATQGMTITGTAIYTAAELDSTGTKQFYWATGRLNDGNNSSYVLNPDTNDHANYGGATTSTITVYEGDFT